MHPALPAAHRALAGAVAAAHLARSPLQGTQ